MELTRSLREMSVSVRSSSAAPTFSNWSHPGHTSLCASVCVCSECVQVCIRVCVNVWMCVQVYVCVHVCVWSRVYVCVCMYVVFVHMLYVLVRVCVHGCATLMWVCTLQAQDVMISITAQFGMHPCQAWWWSSCAFLASWQKRTLCLLYTMSYMLSRRVIFSQCYRTFITGYCRVTSSKNGGRREPGNIHEKSCRLPVPGSGGANQIAPQSMH